MAEYEAGAVFDEAEGVYLLAKDEKSIFRYANTNFAKLIGSTKEAVIGSEDGGPRAKHLQYDRRVMKGEKFMNLIETIPSVDRGILSITTQKAPIRNKDGEIIGITVCFAENKQASEYIKTLNLNAIPLGGWFGKGCESSEFLLKANLPERFGGDRRIYTTNYFLLQGREALAIHSLNQDEVWYFQDGHAIRIHIFHLEDKRYETVVLGKHDVIHFSVPHNTWFGAELVDGGYCLASCSLSPGWDPRDSFSLTPSLRSTLLQTYPDQKDAINCLSNLTRITLVRHGDVENPDKIYYGRQSAENIELKKYPLSETGAAQAKAVAKVLGNQRVAEVYSSPQWRCQQVAAEIGNVIANVYHIDDDLNEVHSPFDGKTQAELEATGWDIYTNGYEQPVDIVNRVTKFMKEIRASDPKSHVVGVTHGDVIKFAVHWAKGAAYDRKLSLVDVAGFPDAYPGHCSMVTFYFTDDEELPVEIEYTPVSV